MARCSTRNMAKRKPKHISPPPAAASSSSARGEQLDGALSQVEQAMERLAQAHHDFAAARDEVAHQHRLTLLGTLVGGIAHEINNVLTPALSYAQMALSRPEDAALAKKALERAAAGATTVAKITGTILEFAKDRRFHVEHGGVVKRCCDIEQVVHEAIGCLVRPPARDGVRLEIEVTSGVMAATDAILLQQVVVNLLSNAVRAMKGQGGTLTVRGGQRHDLAWIEVSDTGPGVPREIAARLFTGVVSGGGEHPHVPRGTGGGHGLGLLISRMLVESDGGALVLMPHDGGARFRIELPVAE